MRRWLLVAMLGCVHVAKSAPAQRCFLLYPLAAGARWTYDVTIESGEGDASTTRHARVIRSVGEVTQDGRVRLETVPDLEDSGVEAIERFRIAPDRVYEGDNAIDDDLLLIASPEDTLAWGGPRSFYPPGDGQWKLVGQADAPPYHDCVKVASHTRYGEIMHVYCANVGPVASEYRETTPRSHDDPAIGHHRDFRGGLTSGSPRSGACTGHHVRAAR